MADFLGLLKLIKNSLNPERRQLHGGVLLSSFLSLHVYPPWVASRVLGWIFHLRADCVDSRVVENAGNRYARLVPLDHSALIVGNEIIVVPSCLLPKGR